MDKGFGIIYKATNKINGKSYIGQTLYPLNVRISQHKHEANRKYKNSHFYKAIRKYGIENFEWRTLGRYSIEELNNIEIKTIEKYDAFDKGYNLTVGGDGVKGMRGEKHWGYGESRPKAVRDRIRETFRKNGTVKGKNNPMYGRRHTEESKKRMSEAKKSYWLITYPDGKKRMVDRLMEFCDNNNLCWAHMYNVASGNVSHHKGYKCKKIYELEVRRV